MRPAFPAGYIPEFHDELDPYDAAMDIADARFESGEDVYIDLVVHQLIRDIKAARGTARN